MVLLTKGEITKANGFGYSVAIDGETIVVGYPFWNSQGQATIYQRNASGWFLTAELTGKADSQLGSSVAVDGDTAAVGARLELQPRIRHHLCSQHQWVV